MTSFSWAHLCSFYSAETVTAVDCDEGLQGRPRNTKTAKSHSQHLDPSHEWAESSEPQHGSVAADNGHMHEAKSQLSALNRSAEFGLSAINMWRITNIHLRLQTWGNSFSLWNPFPLIPRGIFTQTFLSQIRTNIWMKPDFPLACSLWDSDDVIGVISSWSFNLCTSAYLEGGK